MHKHTTDYSNTFIEVADDCPVSHSQIPLRKVEGKSTLATLQYELLNGSPYKYSSDEVIFRCFAEKNNIPTEELEAAEIIFFSKGQACFRSSPLTKRYGFGIHFNENGKIALYPMESDAYHVLAKNPTLKHIKALKTKR